MEEPKLTRNLIPHPPTLLDRLCCIPHKAKAWYEIDDHMRLIHVEARGEPQLFLRDSSGGVFQYIRLGNKRAELLAVSILEVLAAARGNDHATATPVAKTN